MKPHGAGSPESEAKNLMVSYNKAEEKVELSKKKKKLKKRKNYAGSARNKSLHTRFKELPSDETLIDYFVCSVAQDFLPLQGKLYVTHNYIAFYSNYIGLVNRILIPMKAITHISKEKTSKLFVNTISITVAHQQYDLQYDQASTISTDKSMIGSDDGNDNNSTHSSNNLTDNVHVFVNLISHDAAFTLMNTLWNGQSSMDNEATVGSINDTNKSGAILGNESEGYTSDESSKVSSELTGDNTSVNESKEDLKKNLTIINEKVDELFERDREEEEEKHKKGEIQVLQITKSEQFTRLAKTVAYKVYTFLDTVLPSGLHVIYTGLVVMVLLMISTLYLMVRIIRVEERLMSTPTRMI